MDQRSAGNQARDRWIRRGLRAIRRVVEEVDRRRIQCEENGRRVARREAERRSHCGDALLHGRPVLAAYRAEGLNPPKIVREATNEYRTEMDLIGMWIDECCERDPAARTASAVLYCNYEQWAREQVGFSITHLAFGRDLTDRGFKKVKVDSDKGRRGLRLRTKSAADQQAELYANVRPIRRY
jgi:hypothetical protein